MFTPAYRAQHQVGATTRYTARHHSTPCAPTSLTMWLYAPWYRAHIARVLSWRPCLDCGHRTPFDYCANCAPFVCSLCGAHNNASPFFCDECAQEVAE